MSDGSDDPEWLGTPAAAAYLGLNQRTIYKLIDQGDLRSYKLGRVLRFRRADLDVYLEARVIQPGELEHLRPDTQPGGEAKIGFMTDRERLIELLRSFGITPDLEPEAGHEAPPGGVVRLVVGEDAKVSGDDGLYVSFAFDGDGSFADVEIVDEPAG